MVHVLFITPYYPPEKAAPAVRISETAVRLVQRGYEVTVLTTVPNYPTGIVPMAYRWRAGQLMQQEMLEGVRVVRVWSYISPNKGFVRRVLAQFSFGCLAPLLGGKAVGHPDVIIAESPPLFDAIAARLLAWFRHCPFIFLVSDLWPESAIQLGVLRNRLLIRLAEWLEWSTYQRASLVWAVTEGIRQSLLQRGLSARQVFLLTNGVDTARFSPLPQEQVDTARAALGWDGRFTVLYAGTHGLAHGLTTVLEAAELLQDSGRDKSGHGNSGASPYADIHFVLAGEGAAKADLVMQAQKRKLKNVTFLEVQPHERMPLLLASADICLVPLRKLPLFEGALPSKMYEIMACARPMVLGVEGEARRMAVQEAGAALAVEPEHAPSLVTAILYLREHPEVAETMGRSGRAFVEARFDRTQLTTELERRIAEWYTVLAKQDVARPVYMCWCKAMDLVFGMCGLVVLGLLLPIVALLISLDSPGPIFYSQERTGYQGRTFRILKFRSMYTSSKHRKCSDTPCGCQGRGHGCQGRGRGCHAGGEAAGGGWTRKDDARVTRVGRVLRATHLDELPQALNIVRGEMSLIGPRPERPDYVTELEKQHPFYCYRLSTRPGLTGWAQVKYGYGSGTEDELVKLQYDLYYIKHRSFWLDVLIILKTIVEVVRCHGI
ncbi:MAG: hypothetical protein NVSMB27_44020 [Ktedonobacteraceae bacterium]